MYSLSICFKNNIMASHIFVNSQLVNKNFLFTPGMNQRIHKQKFVTKRDSKNTSQDPNRTYDKSLIDPFPHFPLEIPKISRLVYKPINFYQHKR